MEGRCYSYGTRLLYGPFIRCSRGWLGVEDGEAELSVRTKLRAKLGLLPASQLRDVLPYLSRLLSVQLDSETDEHLRLLSPEELGTEIRRAYTTWIASLASQGPLVVALEDLHWLTRPAAGSPRSCSGSSTSRPCSSLQPRASTREAKGGSSACARSRIMCTDRSSFHSCRFRSRRPGSCSPRCPRASRCRSPSSTRSSPALKGILYLEELLSAWVDAGAGANTRGRRP